MPATGYIQVHAYTSYAQIPLQGVSVTVTAADGTAIAMRLTDRSGQITPIELPVPDLAASQSPGTGQTPFAAVSIHARMNGYEQITALQVQVFPDTTTYQDLEMVPLSEFPTSYNASETFDTPPQNL